MIEQNLKICKNCIYSAFLFADSVLGDCRLYPPIFERDRGASGYPRVSPSHWCGQFQEREND